MAQCPSCNKFCALEMQEPESNNLDVTCDETEGYDPDPDMTDEENKEAEQDYLDGCEDRSGAVTDEIRIVRTSECCGDDMKEATFEPEINFSIKGHHGEGHEISVDELSLDALEEGGGRYQKSYYGFEMCVELSCQCGQPVEITSADCEFDGATLTFSDKLAASYMDEC